MVKVSLIGFNKLEERIKKLPTKIQKEVGAEVKFAALEFRELAIKSAPVNDGNLRRGITIKNENTLKWEVVSNANYSAAIEFGTKSKFTPIAGVDSSPFIGQPSGGTWANFIESMRKWVRKKGLATIVNSYTGRKRTAKKDVEMLAYVIARSIYKNGIKPHPFFFKQIPIVRGNLFRRIRNILTDI